MEDRWFKPLPAVVFRKLPCSAIFAGAPVPQEAGEGPAGAPDADITLPCSSAYLKWFFLGTNDRDKYVQSGKKRSSSEQPVVKPCLPGPEHCKLKTVKNHQSYIVPSWNLQALTCGTACACSAISRSARL